MNIMPMTLLCILRTVAHIDAYSTVFVKASSFINRDLAGIVAEGKGVQGGKERESKDQSIGDRGDQVFGRNMRKGRECECAEVKELREIEQASYVGSERCWSFSPNACIPLVENAHAPTGTEASHGGHAKVWIVLDKKPHVPHMTLRCSFDPLLISGELTRFSTDEPSVVTHAILSGLLNTTSSFEDKDNSIPSPQDFQ